MSYRLFEKSVRSAKVGYHQLEKSVSELARAPVRGLAAARESRRHPKGRDSVQIEANPGHAQKGRTCSMRQQRQQGNRRHSATLSAVADAKRGSVSARRSGRSLTMEHRNASTPGIKIEKNEARRVDA